MLLEEHFDTVFRMPIMTLFYYIGKDHYSKFAKVSIFTILVLLPVLAWLLGAIYQSVGDWLEPIPYVVPSHIKGAKQLDEYERQERLKREHYQQWSLQQEFHA